jgi:transcriptional regulator with XRE-family HTH domain
MQVKNPTNILLSNRLRAVMDRDGVNASDVAKAVDMTHVAIGHYLRQDRIPGAVELHKIANFFGVPMEYFLEVDDTAARGLLRRPSTVTAALAKAAKAPERERAEVYGELVQKLATIERSAQELRGTLAQAGVALPKSGKVSSASAAAATKLLKSASASASGRAPESARSHAAGGTSARTSGPARAAGKRSKG